MSTNLPESRFQRIGILPGGAEHMWSSFDDAAVGGLVTALVGALAGAGVLIFRTVKQASRAERRDKVSEYEAIFQRQETRIGWLEAQGVKDREVIGRLQREHGDCQAEMAETYGDLVNLHGICCRHRDSLKRLGEDPGECPALRPRPQRPSGETEFQARTVLHDAKMLEALPKPKPEPP